jgi:hypothetical protein
LDEGFLRKNRGKNVGVVEGGEFADFRGFLQGVLEKRGVWVWFFAGEVVVNRW